MMDLRSSGILCHISSLPSPYGIGDLGPQAYRFVDLLNRSGQKWWQVLPLNPTDNALFNSPYSSYSAFAFNPLFISPQRLVEEGFLLKGDIRARNLPSDGTVNFSGVYRLKGVLLAKAFERYRSRRIPLKDFELFCSKESFWLDDYALFVVLRRKFAKLWSEWPVEYRDRDPAALESVRSQKALEIEGEKFFQYLFYRQWTDLQGYCSRKGIGIIGDIPIYVNYDSVDVWVHPGFFKLDGQKRPFSPSP